MREPTALRLTELEERLARPGGAALRAELLAQLEALESRLRRQLQASVPRSDFANYEAAAQAAHAAIEVLREWPVAAEAPPPLQFPSPYPRSLP